MYSRQRLRTHLANELDNERNDHMVFSVCLVVLTPAFLALAALLLIGAIFYADLPLFDHLPFAVSVLFGGNVLVGFMFLSMFIRPKQDWQRSGDDRSHLMWAGVFYAALLFITHSDARPDSMGALIVIWFALALTTMAFLGKAYAPRDGYYLGVWNGAIDDPFTFEDDWDRAHFSLGMASVVPQALLQAYSEVFASRWLWRRFSEEELDALTDVMYQAWGGKSDVVGQLPKARAELVLRILAELKWMRPHKHAVELSQVGKDLMKAGVK